MLHSLLHVMLPFQTRSLHIIYVGNIPLKGNALFIIISFCSIRSATTLFLELISELQTREQRCLSILRAPQITACDTPSCMLQWDITALAHEKTPTKCCTHLHNQTPVLLRLTEVCAHFKDTHCSFFTQAHPGVIFFSLWQSIPECLKDLPDCFLAH